MQVDVARIGGITPWLKVAHLAETFNVPVCPHFLMELHVALCCAVPNARWVEYIPQLDTLTQAGMRVETGPRGAVGGAGARYRLGFGGDRASRERRALVSVSNEPGQPRLTSHFRSKTVSCSRQNVQF